LQGIGVDDGGDETGEAGIDFGATRGVVHLNAFALGVDESGFAEYLEVLGERGLRDRPVDDVLKGRAGGRALRSRDLRKDSYSYGVRESVEDRFDGDILDCGME
jgi:hypothetical protein